VARGDDVPHAYKVLHHKLVEGFRGVGHVNLPWPISEISLQMGSLSDCRVGVGGYTVYLLCNICHGCCVIKVETWGGRLCGKS